MRGHEFRGTWCGFRGARYEFRGHEFRGHEVRVPGYVVRVLGSGGMLRHANRPRPVSRKISKNSVNNRPCLSNEVASLDDLAVRALIFRAKRAQF